MASKSPNDSLQLGISFEIKIGGKVLPKEIVVMKIHVKSDVNKISKASVSILGGNSYESIFPESENVDFEPGKEIVISIGYAEKTTQVFSGIIVKHRLSISEGYLSYASRSLVVLEAADKAIKMTLEKKSDLYEKKKDSDVITTLVSGAGLTKKVDATTLQHDFISRHNCTDWEFILNRAAANGMVVLNAENKITVEVPKVSGTEKATVIYGKDAFSFHADLDAVKQLQQLESLTYDIYEEKEITQSGTEPAQLDKPGTVTGKTLGKVAAPDKLKWNVHVPIQTKELKALADAGMVLSRMKRINGEVSFRGMTELILGSLIKLDGFGKLFNGLAYVTGVEHRVDNGEFLTKVTFGLKDEWLKASNSAEFQIIPPISGLHVGIVKKIDADPDKKNRIQVMIPSLKNSGDGIWAMLSHFYANKNAGSFFVPELNSEVIIGFIDNDPRFPVVLGSLYSKNNTPKDSFTKENYLKSIETKAGVRLEFNDEDKAFKILTPGKNTLLISDKSKGVTIEDQNGNVVTTSDKGVSITSKKDITLNATGKLELKGSKGIVINSSGGDVTADGKNLTLKAKAKIEVSGSSGADIKSSSVVNIKGSMVNVN
jgi:phage protein D/phage baseplate assembly protein gpV